MVSTIASVDSREVVRCDHCFLVQFSTTSRLCRRCHLSLDEDEAGTSVTAPTASEPANATVRGHMNLARSVRSLRLRNGLSQRQLALRMAVPRTYVQKIENERAVPTLSSLERLARAFEVTVAELLFGEEVGQCREVGALMEDEFVAEILPYLGQLSGLQMSSVLAQVRDLALRARQST